MSLSDFQLSDAQPEGFSEQTFVIDDDKKAVWAFRKLATAQKRIDDARALAKEEIERIETWANIATLPDQRTVEYFQTILTSYALREREKGRKSLILPDGEVSTRATPDKISVSDKDVFEKWALEHRMSWLRTKFEPDLAKIKAETKDAGELVVDAQTGEVIDGLSHVDGSVSVSFKVTV